MDDGELRVVLAQYCALVSELLYNREVKSTMIIPGLLRGIPKAGQTTKSFYRVHLLKLET